MPKPRQYENNAEKQRAYRDRHAAKRPPRESELAALARTLRGKIKDAAARGDVLAQELAAERADDVLRNLIREFDRRGA